VNRTDDTTAHDHTARIARAAWFCAFVLPLILIALLLGVKSSRAATPGPIPLATSSAFEEELSEDEAEFDEQDEAEFAQQECEIAEEEAAEGEIDQAEVEEVCWEAAEAAEAAKPGSGSGSATAGHRHRHHSHRHRHRHKKTCKHRTHSHKRHCPHRPRHR